MLKSVVRSKKEIAISIFLFASFTAHSGINLQLNKKPSLLSVYGWCILKAEEHVRFYKTIILNKLGINPYNWETIKKQYAEKYKEDIRKLLAPLIKKPLDQRFKKLVRKFLNQPYVKNVFGITSIDYTNDAINIATKKGPIKIIVCADKQTQATGNHIIIDEIEAKNSPSYELSASIAHEISHVYCDHTIEKFCINTTYDQIGKKVNYTQQAYCNDLLALKKAQEREADIISIYGDLIAGKKTEISMRKWIEKNNFKVYGHSSHMLTNYINTQTLQSQICFYMPTTHPSHEERLSYISQINNAMEDELRDLNLLTPQTLYQLGKLELLNKQYYKAYKLLSLVSSSDNKYTNKINLLKNYALGQIYLLRLDLKNAYSQFMSCATQDFNNEIKAKSLLALGMLHVNSYKNNLQQLVNTNLYGIQCLMHAAQQNYCKETKDKAQKIIKSFLDSNINQNPVY